jgi:cytochrome c553
MVSWLLRCLILGFGLCVWMGAHATQPFEDNMAQRTLACTACHGEQGRAGPDGYYPRLAGKPATYLYQQLLNFRDGRRHYAPMTGLLDNLDDTYLRAMADYFSAQSVPYPAPQAAPTSAAEQERGRRLVLEGNKARSVPACTQCHGLQLTGVNPDIPGLLGLPADYLNAQLGGWQTGQRATAAPDCMAAIAKRMTAADIHAAARWLSTQPVPLNARAADHKPPPKPADVDLQCARLAQPQTAPPVSEPRGAYLARLGTCAHCHTARGGAAYAGGRPLDTPFGTVFSSNLTADREHGIGAWSADEFWRALHHGEARGGRLLYPAFPYTSFTHISRADADALFAYLQTVPAQPQANKPHALRWPFSTQWALRVWRMLFFSPAAAAPPLPSGNTELQRGAYLVQGLGHCLECHGARNAMGALSGGPGGAVLPGDLWFAPSLNDPAQASVVAWTVEEITRYLQTGTNGRALASGPMAEVVLHGSQYLNDADARAMALYLKGLPQTAAQAVAKATGSPVATQTLSVGAKLYESHCADCHGLQGQGRENTYPALAGNRAVLMDNSNNLVHSVLGGGFAPATAGHARPFGMPPFMLRLTDREMAAVLSYVRNAWGNQASALSEFDINKLRRSQAP